MLEILAVGAGGFIGSALRYGITKLTAGFAGSFPLGTLISNALAGLFVGFIIGVSERVNMPIKTKLFLATGLTGGLSTFSAFSVETIELFKSGKYLLSLGNIGLNLVLSFAGVVIGLIAAKTFVKQG